MKLLLIVLAGIAMTIAVPDSLNIQCITDMECELMFGPDEGED